MLLWLCFVVLMLVLMVMLWGLLRSLEVVGSEGDLRVLLAVLQSVLVIAL